AGAQVWHPYCDGYLYSDGMQCWSAGWNYYYANRMYHNNDPNGPLLRVMEHLPNGSWVNTVSGNGNITFCHARIYVETGSQNRSPYWLYASSAKLTGGVC
ncbi:MAG: hypothetical protein ACRDPL_12250, partial [Propionibacteriaceae bacterium]